MRKIRFIFSLIIAKLAYFFLKVTKLSSGTAFIGLIVLKICPDFLKYANDYSKTKINVTGTNGKTTTTALIAHVLKSADKDIIYNSTGANMLTGVVNSVSLQINLNKKAEFSVIEADEAHLSKVYENYNSDYLLVTNLFEDQLDRYGSLEGTRNVIQKAIDKKPDIQLILNADDPFVVGLKSQNKEAIYFGVESVNYSACDEIKDKEVLLPCICGKNLNYSKRFYSKIGHYSCECGFLRPQVKYNAIITVHKNHCETEINGVNYTVPVMGLFNAYNAVGAISMLLENGILPDVIKKQISTFKVFSGRCEYKMLNGHKTLIQLIKNPVGATEVMKTIDLESNILVGVNDNIADGRDVSWIKDAEFELLKDAKHEIIVTGLRSKELAERLTTAGCSIKVIPEIEKAVDYVGQIADNDITILPNYTVYMKISKMKGFKECC